MINDIIVQFGFDPSEFAIEQIGTGHINQTFKLNGDSSFILQRINITVFRKPEIIASNLRIASNFLDQHYPEYFFLSAIKTRDGRELVYDQEGFPWRLFPYISNTVTVDKVGSPDEAFQAAAGFAKLVSNLSGCEVSQFKPTIDRFHDLTWRYEQFETALKNTTSERKKEAASAIRQAQRFAYLSSRYDDLIRKGGLIPRVTHNDTKINNILFDAATNKAVCVIDLDTLMPGYFIYDIGDMIRTCVSPVSEEEKDISKIAFRGDIYQALIEGYQEQMRDALNDTEKTLAPFGGMMMTYIMAIRFLADFLNGNVYYHITYPEQNLVRATNQLQLLHLLEANFNLKA